MRAQGVVHSASGLLPFGHLGWAYRDRAEFLARAREYIADGLAAGQWVEYVGDAEHEGLRRELAGALGPRSAAVLRNVGVSTIAEFYEFDAGRVDPAASARALVAATEKAVASGYTGFRAVVDATALVRTAAQRDRFACLEYLIDQKTIVLPAAAVCAYDVAELGAVAGELLCLHPFTGPGSCPFRLYADTSVAFALSGELDLAGEALFDLTLSRTLSLSASAGRAPLVIDGRGLDFVDHRGLRNLERHLERVGVTGVLRTDSGLLRRVADLIELRWLRVESPGA